MQNTFVIPVVRDDLLARCLETLYRHNPPTFYVFVVDQTGDGIATERLRRAYKNLLVLRTPRTDVHTTGNLGFAKAVNLAAALVQTPFLTICNDDVEFVHRNWWDAALDTFRAVERQTPDRPAAMVNPLSVKVPHWAMGRPPGQDHLVLPYRETYSDQDWERLVGEVHRLPGGGAIQPSSHYDRVEMFCTVTSVAAFRQIGPLNERFYPGGGEDYEYCRRAAAHGFRCVTTSRSWVFHHWSRSRRIVDDPRRNRGLVDERLRWNNMGALWGRDPQQVPPATIRPL